MNENLVVSKKAVSAANFEAGLVSALAKFECGIFLIHETVSESETLIKRVNAKSLIGVLSLELKGGEMLTVIVSGTDEREAAEKIKELLTM